MFTKKSLSSEPRIQGSGGGMKLYLCGLGGLTLSNGRDGACFHAQYVVACNIIHCRKSMLVLLCAV